MTDLERLDLARLALKDWSKQKLSDRAALTALWTILFPQRELTKEEVDYGNQLTKELELNEKS